MSDNSAQQQPQRRVFTRIPFQVDYRLHDPNKDNHWVGQVIDLSLKGALIECPDKFEPVNGDEYVLELILAEDELKVVMLVSIVHAEKGHIGFHCHHIDLESLSHLRKILEYNLGKPELVEREIKEMMHIVGSSH